MDFNPNSPVKPAGMRIDPPPSPPVAIGTRPPATAAADPPEEPPGVRPGSHGLRVTPCSLVDVQLTPPNSEAVVWPARTAPAARSRETWVESEADTRSAKTSDASVKGHPATGSSSLTPMGTPPKGRDTSARAAWVLAASASTSEKAFRSEASMAANDASRASVGLRVLARKASTSEQASPSHGSVMVPTLPVGQRRCSGRCLGDASGGAPPRWPSGV